MDLEELAMLLECVDVNSITPTEFSAALERAKSCSFEDDQKLVLYGLFKQATVGNINIEAPAESDVINHAKWYEIYNNNCIV
jgi:acyl-CoA-binding protein